MGKWLIVEGFSCAVLIRYTLKKMTVPSMEIIELAKNDETIETLLLFLLQQ